MKFLLSKLLLLSSGILAAHASDQPAYTIRDFDPATYNHTQGSSQYSGYPNITAFTVELEGGSEWNTMSTYKSARSPPPSPSPTTTNPPSISFNATFIDTTDPVVTTTCMAYGYVFNPGCYNTYFGGGVVAYTKFDLKLNEDRSADLLIRWQPQLGGTEWKTPTCWQELNVTKHIPADQILGPIPAGGEGGFLWVYTGVDHFFPDGQSVSWGGDCGEGGE